MGEDTSKDIPFEIFNIIKQLVKTDKVYKANDLKKLLPVDSVSKGWAHPTNKLEFVDPRNSTKYQESFDPHNENERLKAFSELNKHIRDYNQWAEEECRRYNQEEEDAKWQKSVDEFLPHLFEIRISAPQNYRRTEVKDIIKLIDDKRLYYLKEELTADEFVLEINKDLFKYIKKQVLIANNNDCWDKDNIWYQPNKEFVHWFQSKGIDIDKVPSLLQEVNTIAIEKEEIIVSSKDKIKDKAPEELINGKKTKKWTFKDDFKLCERLEDNNYESTPEEESRMKNKTFLSNRTKWWDRPKRKYRDKFLNILEELKHQTQMEVTTFKSILIVKSKYHSDALLNAFKYAVNHPHGILYAKANKKTVSIKKTRKSKILLLD